MKEIYLVSKGSGEYEDYHEHISATFETQEEAEEYMKDCIKNNKTNEINDLYNEWYNSFNEWPDDDFDDVKEFTIKYPQYSEDEVWAAISQHYDSLIILYKLKLGNPAEEIHIKTEYLN